MRTDTPDSARRPSRARTRSAEDRITGARLAAALLALLLAAPAAAGVKTDTVVLTNGDRLTGEVKTLGQGQLIYKTDSMETVSVKWDWVARLASPNWFLVTVADGAQYYGQLHAADAARTLAVGTIERTFPLAMDDVVRIERIKEGFWDRVDLSLNVGFSYTRAGGVLQYTFDGRTAYRDRVHFGELKLSSITTDTEDDAATRRVDVVANYQRTITGRLFWAGQLGSQSNDELGLQLRVLVAGGAGYRLVENSSSLLTAIGGLSANREWSTTDEEAVSNLEGLLASTYSLFFLETPKTDLQVSVAAYPGLSVRRARVEADLALSREVVKDLVVTVSYYESYDSAPPSAAAASTDRGVVLKVGWSK